MTLSFMKRQFGIANNSNKNKWAIKQINWFMHALSFRSQKLEYIFYQIYAQCSINNLRLQMFLSFYLGKKSFASALLKFYFYIHTGKVVSKL